MFIVERIKTKHILFKAFFQKSCRLSDNVEEYGRVRSATEDDVVLRTRTACRIHTTTNTRSECRVGIAFPRQQWLLE